MPRGQGLSLSGLPDTGFQHDGAHTVDLGCLAKHESFHNLAGGSSLREGPELAQLKEMLALVHSGSTKQKQYNANVFVNKVETAVPSISR